MNTLMLIIGVIFTTLSIQVAAMDHAEISKKQFGEKWPLSINSGVVKCLPIGNGSVVFEADDKIYAVNGTAKGFAKQMGFIPIEEIWLDDPKFFDVAQELAESENKPVSEMLKLLGKPSKIDIGPVLDAGVKLCN